MKLVRSLIIAAVTTTFAGVGAGQQVAPGHPAQPRGGRQAASPAPADTVLAQLSGSLRQLAAKVSPGVVEIEVSGLGAAEDGAERGATVIVRRRTIGAGVILAADGYIMTNAHVVEGAQRIRVLLSPAVSAGPGRAAAARALEATVVGVEDVADLALLKVAADDLPALRLELERVPQPGELVFAIGSPDGLQNTVTLGVISSASRQPDPDHPMVYLQTDAPINHGNSGGPLVDVTGAVVGLNTFILSRGGGSEGLGFAIPARVVDFVYRSLRESGRVDRVEIGVVPQVITPTLAEGLGLARDWGVVIADVLPGGPAEAAGVQPGDIVEAVDGSPVQSLIELAAALFQHPRDELLAVDVLRAGERHSFLILCIPARERIDALGAVPDPLTSRIGSLGVLGLDVDARLRALVPNLRIGTGVLVLGHTRGFDSLEAGLLPGDVIHELNRTPVVSVGQLRALLGRLEPRASVVLTVERTGLLHYLAFEME